MAAMRICSFVPSATEMLFALGLGDQVVGVSHECDYPPEVTAKPRVTTGLIDPERLSSAEIDTAVSEAVRAGSPLYEVDLDLLRRLQPDLIVTQDLCNVCAVEGNHVREATTLLDPRPRLVSLQPSSLREMVDGIWALAEAAGVASRAVGLANDLQNRIEALREKSARLDRPSTLCLEWLDPAWIAGHWMPEIVELAGGEQVLARAGTPSIRAPWADIAAAAPEVVIVMPCGFDVERTLQEVRGLDSIPQFRQLPAFRSGRVYVVDGSAYFNRAGPRLVEGAELLARLLHPDVFPGEVDPQAALQLASAAGRKRLAFEPITGAG